MRAERETRARDSRDDYLGTLMAFNVPSRSTICRLVERSRLRKRRGERNVVSARVTRGLLHLPRDFSRPSLGHRGAVTR